MRLTPTDTESGNRPANTLKEDPRASASRAGSAGSRSLELYRCRVVFDAFRGMFRKLSGKCACERLPVFGPRYLQLMQRVNGGAVPRRRSREVVQSNRAARIREGVDSVSGGTPAAFDGVPNFFGESFDPGHLLANFGNFAAKSVDFAAKVTDFTARFFDCLPQGRKFRAGGALADEDEAGQDQPDGQGSDQQRTHPTETMVCSPAVIVTPALDGYRRRQQGAEKVTFQYGGAAGTRLLGCATSRSRTTRSCWATPRPGPGRFPSM